METLREQRSVLSIQHFYWKHHPTIYSLGAVKSEIPGIVSFHMTYAASIAHLLIEQHY